MQLEPIVRCRSCGGERLHVTLELGEHCVSDFVEDGGEPDRAPLTLVQCEDCTLVQLQHTVPRERLYRRYWYRSGTNESMVAALLDVVKDNWASAFLREGDRWLDIGANDGTLLNLVGQQYPGIRRTGVEPSETFLADTGWRMKPGDHAIHSFFPPPDWVEPEPCKIITSIAMFYDLDDPNGFCQAIKRWLHPDGVWIIQMSTLERMLEMNAFDNICHEHLEYYSVRSLWRLLSRHGLHVAGISGNRVNGGSLRFAVKHGVRLGPPFFGSRPPGGYSLRSFADRVSALRTETLRLLGDLRDAGELVLGYGASTKGNTLLQYYGIGPDLLTAIADRDPAKWGRHTVGSGIPIISERDMREFKPDYALILPWHFLDSFMRRESEFLLRGGKFIVPLPYVRVVGVEEMDLGRETAWTAPGI